MGQSRLASDSTRQLTSTFNVAKTTQGSCNSSVMSALESETAMRHCYSRLTPSVIHNQARQVLFGCLDWKPFRETVSAIQLVDLVLFMAATAASLSDTI